MMKTLLLSISFLFFTISCNNPKSEKLQKQDPKGNKLPNKKIPDQSIKNISTEDAVKLAEEQFNKYLPIILETHNAYIDSQDTFTGDFTGDGIEDILIYFSLAPKEGGNTIVGQGLALYKNDGKNVKVIAGFEPDYLFSFKKISGGKIYIEKLEYAETDGRCCPSIKTKHILTISGSKVY